MKKKTIVCAIVLCAGMLLTSVKASEKNAGITFDGDAKNFINPTQTTDSYVDMMPGETRSQTIQLTNNDFETMNFYVKVDEAKLLNEQQGGNIVYDITFKNDGDTFYMGRIGGKNKASKDTLTENYLLKTLKKGESTEIEMAIKIDGTSMSNEYQGSNGNLNIIFNVEHPQDNQVTKIIKKVPVLNMIPGVRTGDATNVYILLGTAAIGIFVMMMIWKRRKDEKHDET